MATRPRGRGRGNRQPTESGVSFRLNIKTQVQVPDDVMKEIGEIVRDDVIKGIKAQKQLDGQPLKHNAPSTTEAKKRKGLKPLSLLAEVQRFISRTTYNVRASANRVRITMNGEARKIAIRLDKMGYTGWFGVGPRVIRPIQNVLKKNVERLFK